MDQPPDGTSLQVARGNRLLDQAFVHHVKKPGLRKMLLAQ
jgi:hypothetical protein